VLGLFFLRPKLRVQLDSGFYSAHNPPVIVHKHLRLEPKLLFVPWGRKGGSVFNLLNSLWSDEGQDIAEYAVMLAVILVLVVGTIRLIGSNANNVFSNAASSIQ
jgi:Flp pilus assembly pilin Flp